MADVTVVDGALLHRHDVYEGRGTDNHSAGVLGQVFGEAVQLGRQVDKVPPHRGVHPVPEFGKAQHLGLQVAGVEEVHPLGQLVHILGGKPQGLAQVPDGPLQLVGADHSGEGCMVPAPLLMDSLNQLLPDVAGEVQVDVRHRAHVVGEEPVEGEIELQRVYVGQADEIAHQHGHRRPPATARRTLLQGYLHVAQAQFDHNLPGHLDDVVIDEKKPGQVVPLQQPELLLQAGLHLRGDAAVPAHRRLSAQALQVGLGRVVLGHRVIWEAVIQVVGEVEAATFGYPQGVFDSLWALAEQLRHLLRGLEVKLAVGTPFPVGLLQAPVVLNGDQGVLEPVPPRRVVVDVVCGDHPYIVLAGQLHQPPVALGVAPDQVLLQLHENVGLSEPIQVLFQLLLGVAGTLFRQKLGDSPLSAAGEKDDAFGQVWQMSGVQARVPALSGDVGVGDGVAQVGIPLARLGQQGQVGPVLEGGFHPGDGLHLKGSGHLGEVHGSAQVIMVGEG